MRFRISLALLVSMALGVPSAFAQDDAEETDGPELNVFSQDGFHFEYPDGVTISTQTVAGFEGDVEVVTITPVDPVSGVVAAQSFLTFSVFSAAINAPHLEDFSNEERALEVILSGVMDAFPDNVEIDNGAESYSFGGQNISGQVVRIQLGETVATVEAGALAGDGESAVVFYDQRYETDETWFATFDLIRDSFAWGAPVEEPGDETDGDEEE